MTLMMANGTTWYGEESPGGEKVVMVGANYLMEMEQHSKVIKESPPSPGQAVWFQDVTDVAADCLE